MPLPTRLILTVALTALLSLPLAGFAAEGVLWKVPSRYQASVVPPFTGQPAPFPVASAEKVSETSLSLEELELERRQQEGIEQAQQLIASPQALVPYMEGAVVGGMVEGLNGRKILLGNNWVGPGMKMTIRLVASEQVREAVNRVAEYNPEQAQTLRGEITQRLRETPVTVMQLREIRSDGLVLQGDYGQKIMKFQMR